VTSTPHLQVRVQEVTIVRPDIIRVEVRDETMVRYPPITLGSPHAGAFDTDIQLANPHSVDGVDTLEWGRLMNQDKTIFKHYDRIPNNYLDVAAATVAGDYGLIGAHTVTAVGIRTEPLQHAGDENASFSSMQHFLWLKLDGDLSNGSYTIDFPAATGLDNYAFEYDDRETRCSSIQSTHVGHGAADPLKMAYMSALPFGVGFGPQSFDDFPTFYIINAVGGIVYAGDIVKSLDTTDYGATLDEGFTGGLYYVDTTIAVKTITGITKANPLVITCNGHGYSGGYTDRVTINGLGTHGSTLHNAVQTQGSTVSNYFIVGDVTANTFALYHQATRLTVTFSTALTAGNSFSCTLNGVAVGPIAFATSHALTMAAIATAIAAAKASTSCTVSGNTLIVRQTAASQYVTLASAAITGGSAVTTTLLNTASHYANIPETGFELFASSLDGTSVSDFTTTYYSAHGNELYTLYHSGRHGTHIYRLDYSDWTDGAPGYYRVYVPGLGVSDEWRIGNAVYYDVARNAYAGLYHQSSGRICDGRYGYTRPINYADGENGVRVDHCSMPAVVCQEFGYARNFSEGLPTLPGVQYGGPAMLAPWDTDEQCVGWAGGLHDAGDWDTDPGGHAVLIAQLIEQCVQDLTEDVRDWDFGGPKSSEEPTLDSSLYTSNTDVLPEAMHMAIWYFDTFRRTQRVDGRVVSGTLYGTTAGAGQLAVSHKLEPSCYATKHMRLCAADPPSNYDYSLAAGKIAWLLLKLGSELSNADITALGEVWKDSAILAFEWAEDIMASTAAFDAYFDAPLPGGINLRSNMGWSLADYQTWRDTVRLSTSVWMDKRDRAVGVMWALEPLNATYKTLTEAAEANSVELWSRYQYIHPDLEDFTDSTIRNTTFISASGGFYSAPAAYDAVNEAMGGFMWNHTPLTNGIGENDPLPVSRAYWTAQREEEGGVPTVGDVDLWIKRLIAAFHFPIGCNGLGRSFTNGIGYRGYGSGTLHQDGGSLGLLESPPGITHFGLGILPGGGGGLSLSTDSLVNYTAVRNLGAAAGGPFETAAEGYGPNKIVRPYNYAVPYHQYCYAISTHVNHMEYSFGTVIVPRMATAMQLAAMLGYTEQTHADPKIRARLKLAA
jgi:hypothetical protein